MLPLFEYSAQNGPIVLRPYQEESKARLLDAIASGEHPVCGLATGGGKSILIAALCGELPGRILVVTHRKELLTQNSNTLKRFLPNADYGIYSAGLNQRDMGSRVIFGGIQSVYRRIDDLQEAGPFRAVIVDEAHRVGKQDDGTMYSQILEICSQATRIGFSATPYRLNEGPIYGEDGTWFSCMPSHIGIQDLTDMDYLTPLRGTQTAANVPLDKVRKQGGEFVLSDLSQRASEESVATLALDELCYLAQNYHSWLVFCVDVAHTRLITHLLQGRGVDARCIVGTTPNDERESALNDFRDGQFRALVNCQVGTEGFDIPCVDCVAMLRPTMSKALVVQMLGRGTRLFSGKKETLVLDMAGNLERHVPLDGIPEYHKSPTLIMQEQEAERREQEARERLARHGIKASDMDPLYAKEVPARLLGVEDIRAKVTSSKKHRNLNNILVTYRCHDDNGNRVWVNHWLCPEYSGWPREQSEHWFMRRGLNAPQSASAGLRLIYRAIRPTAILTGRKGGFDRLEMEYFNNVEDTDEVPF